MDSLQNNKIGEIRFSGVVGLLKVPLPGLRHAYVCVLASVFAELYFMAQNTHKSL